VIEELSLKRRATLAVSATTLLIALAATLARWSQVWAYTGGLEFALVAGAVILVVALLVAIPLGTLAASGPRTFDSVLRLACDLVSSVPTLFVVAVLWVWSERTLSYVCALGVLRGLEQAWLLRCEIVRLEAEDPDAAPRSLGGTPLAAVWRMRLPAALGPLFVSASFNVAWLTALDAALTEAGLRPALAMPTWGIVLASPHSNPLTAVLAAGSVALLTLALHVLFRPPRAG